MSRKVDEPLDVLLGRINTKYDKAFPTADLTMNEHKQQITERFVKALIFGSNSIDATLGQHLQVHKPDVTTPQLMLKAANDLLPLFVLTSPSMKPIQIVNAEPSLSEQDVNSLEDRIVNRLTAVLQLPHSSPSQESTKACDDVNKWHKERHDNKVPPSQQEKFFLLHMPIPQHFACSCPYRNACRRCWKEGHRTHECPEPKPCPCPLNFEGAGRETTPVIHSTLPAHSQLLMTDILVSNQKLRCLCDTGAEVNLLPLRFANRHGLLLKIWTGLSQLVWIKHCELFWCYIHINQNRYKRSKYEIKVLCCGRHRLWHSKFSIAESIGGHN